MMAISGQAKAAIAARALGDRTKHFGSSMRKEPFQIHMVSGLSSQFITGEDDFAGIGGGATL